LEQQFIKLLEGQKNILEHFIELSEAVVKNTTELEEE
jgi:hypothetical protein